MLKRLSVILLWSAPLWASCTGSSPVWTSTPDSASLTICLANAARNDTINVQAGSATWNSAIVVTKGVTLTGAGAINTVITNGAGNIVGTGMLEIQPDSTTIANSDNIKVSGFTFDGAGTSYYIIHVTGSPQNGTKPYKNIIITNNTIQKTNTIQGDGNTGILVAGQVRGVIANNTFINCDFPWRTFGNDDTRDFSNAAYNSFSFGSADNLYIETNTVQFNAGFTSSDQSAGWIESGQGGRWVVRFNTWNLTNVPGSSQTEFFDVHGFQNFCVLSGGNCTAGNNGQTGTMITEYYRNTLTNTASSSDTRWIFHRGGWGMYFDNSLSGSVTYDIEVGQYAPSTDARSGCYPFILNPDNSTFTGADGTIANTYAFNNTVNGTLTAMTVNSSINNCSVNENGTLSPYGTGLVYGWWNQQASFTGTVGVGRGVLASRPATCTTGVGYWATDQGSWNQSGNGTGNGVFYKCTAANTWTLYYTPYTYPNPLLGSVTPPPAPATTMFAGNSIQQGTVTLP